MAEIRWSSDPSPAWSTMTPTDLLTDGTAGDATTFESSTDSTTVGYNGGACQQLIVDVSLTAQVRNSRRYLATSWRATGSLSVFPALPTVACSIPIGDPVPPTGHTAGLVFQSFDTATNAWVTVDSVTLTVPTPVTETTSSISFSTGARAIADTTSCNFRLVLEYELRSNSINQTVTLTALLSDFRIVSVSTDVACDGTEVPPDTDPPPVPEPDPDPSPDTVAARECIKSSGVPTRSDV